MAKLVVCCLTTIVGFSFSTLGATLTKQGSFKQPQPVLLKTYRDRVVWALRQPSKERVLGVRPLGEKGFEILKELAFDSKESVETRWRAIISIGQVWPNQSISTLEKALSSREWFVRNAAMIALTYGSRKKALEWADRLLDDKALVVRTAAVQVIEQMGGRELSDKMWSRLNATENFRHNKSLWIRKHIARTLSHFGRPEDIPHFIRLLNDRDTKLHSYAIKGLEKATGQVLDYDKTTTYWKKMKWLAWWQNWEKPVN